MALLHPNSCECLHSGLELFSVPPTQTAVEEGHFVEVHPLASLAPGAPIEFSVSGSSEDYLDLCNTFIHVRCRVALANGANIPPDVDVAPVNYYLHSLFSQIDVTLNESLISPSENTYPYRATIEALLNYGKEAKKGHLTAALYFSDTPKFFDDTKGDSNIGLKTRRQLASSGKEIDVMGKIHSYFFNQDRFLLNGVDVKIKLTPSKDTFNLIADDATVGYKSVITYAALVVRKAKLNPAVSLAHEKALMQGNAKYPLKRVVLKSFTITKGLTGHIQDNLFLSQTPTRIVIGLVTSAAFNGSYKSDPFNFQHFGLQYLNVSLDGRTVATGKPLTCNFEQDQYARAFFNTNLAMGLIGRDAGIGLQYADFKHGNALYAFDLTPSLLDGEIFELAKSGVLSLELKFATSTPEPLQVVVYAEFDSIIEISKTRQVLLEYAS